VCVAPISLAFSSFERHRVNPMRCGRRRCVPLDAPDPTPPHPTTDNGLAGLDLARSTADPKPVEIPQLMSAAALHVGVGSMRPTSSRAHHFIGKGPEVAPSGSSSLPPR